MYRLGMIPPTAPSSFQWRRDVSAKWQDETALESHVAAVPTISAKVSAFTLQANSEMSLRGSGQVRTSVPAIKPLGKKCCDSKGPTNWWS